MKSPLQFQPPFALWTWGLICTAFYRQHRIKLNLTSIGRLLAQLGLIRQKPLFGGWQRNPPAVQKWLEQEYPKIQSLAKRTGAESVFEDECTERSGFHSGSSLAAGGKTLIAMVTGERFNLNMFSAISPRGNLRFMVERGEVRAQVFIGFLKRLIQSRRRRVFLIVDGHPPDRTRIVRTHIEALAGEFRLLYLAPYLPELNPDELAWNNAKNNGVARMLIVKTADLKNAVVGRLRYLQKTLGHDRSFFQVPQTKYAA